jgi:hypothetical protein
MKFLNWLAIGAILGLLWVNGALHPERAKARRSELESFLV